MFNLDYAFQYVMKVKNTTKKHASEHQLKINAK
jgi:hypothetical protein